MDLGKLIATLGVDSRGLNTAISDFNQFEKKINNSTSQINNNLKTIGKQAKNVGKEMSKYLTVPLTAVGVGAIKLHKDFESSLTKIVGLVGVARGQVDQWGRDILELAPKVAKPPAELADALFFVTSAGIRGAEAMRVLEMSAKASAAGLGETKVVADLVTSALNAYGTANLSAQQATDILVKAVREGKAEAPALAASMGMVLPIASAMGVSFDQVGAAIAAMTRTGTNAQTASVQLRQILASLLKPTSQAKDALTAMGTSAEELRKIVREQGVLAALMKLRDLTNQYGEETMSTILPNIRALSGVLDLMGSNIADNVKIFESLADSTGTLDTAFNEVTGDVDFKFKKAISTAQVALINLGDAMKSDVTRIFEGFTRILSKVISWFNNLSSSQKQLVTRIAATIAIAGPLLAVLGYLMTNVLPGLVTAGGAVIKMFNLLRIAMLSNPFTATAIAIGFVVSALIMMKKRTNEVTAAQKALDTVNKTALSNIAEQKTKVEQLIRIAKSEHASLQQRKAAIEELNKVSPKYFGNLSLETINTVKSTKAIEAYVKELLRAAKVRAAQEKLIELEKRAMDELVLGEANHLSLLQKISAISLTQARANEKGSKIAIKNFNKTKNEIDSTREALQTFIDSLLKVEDITSTMGARGGVDLGMTSGGGTNKIVEDFSKMKQELSDTSWSSAISESARSVRADIKDALWLGDINESIFGTAEAFENMGERMRVVIENTPIENLRQSLANMSKELIDMGADSKGILDFARNVVTAGKKIIATYLAEGVAGAVKNALSDVPFPFNLIAAGIAGGAAAALFNGLVPSFAEGGIVNGPTMAMVGDNPAGREAIVPLEKANEFGFGGNRQHKTTRTLVHEISGRNLRILLQEEEDFLSNVT